MKIMEKEGWIVKRIDFYETKELFLEIINFTNWKFSEENNAREQTILISFLNFPLPTHKKERNSVYKTEKQMLFHIHKKSLT